mgnify:CR=1 FL=1
MKRAILPVSLAIACSSPAEIPEPKLGPNPTRSCDAVVRSSSADAVMGEFTDWEEVALVDGAATFSDLAPGEYAYALLTDGEVDARIPASAYTKWHDGTEYRNLRVADCNVPGWRVDEARIEDGTLTAKLVFESAVDGTKLDPTSVQVSVGGVETSVQADPETGTVLVEKALDAPGKYTLLATATDADGRAVESDLWLPLWHDGAQKWTWQDALLYLVFTDRFRDTDGAGASDTGDVQPIAAFQGGDFAGVTQAIEEGYFDALGVNALWLSPVYDNPEQGYLGMDGVNLFTGYHGYWPIDPTIAEPTYGGDEALHELIGAAHARGMRIVFDVVLNHVHEDHIYCDEHPQWCETTCQCGTENCAWEGEGGRPRDCQFAPYLPDLDYREHAIVERVVDDVFALAKKFDVDGFRVDAAKHMDHVIMRTLRLRTKELEAQGAAPFWLIGETFTGDRGLIMDYVAEDELHGQFDFPLYYAIRGTFAHGGSFKDLEGAASAGQREYGVAYPWMSPFLGNHDIERFMSAAAGNVRGGFEDTPDLMAEGDTEVTQWDLINRASMAFAFLLTQPGIPLIYYGDEVGLAGGPDPDNRRAMPAGLNPNRLELLRRVQQLGTIRSEVAALRHGGRKELWLDDDFYVYVRDGAPGAVAIVGMNKDSVSRTETVTIPNALGLAGAKLESLNSEREATVIDGTIRLTLDPWEYVILAP